MYEESDPFQEEFGSPPNLVTKLTLQEIEIALSFLKRRFPRFTIQKIVATLDHYNFQKSKGMTPRMPVNRQQAPEPRRMQTLANRWEVDQGESKEQKKQRDEEQVRLVARLFCEGGDDYTLIRRYLPELSATSYRNMLLSIANSAFRDLTLFLKKDCRLKTKDLTQAQKVTIKTAIISAHEWMGTKSLQAIETLFKFISNKFNNSRKAIDKSEAVELYSVIAQRVNHNSLDLLSLQPQPDFGQQIQAMIPMKEPKPQQFEEGQDLLKLVGQGFLECCDLDRLSLLMMKKYGMSPAWEEASLKLTIRKIIQDTLCKLKFPEGRRSRLPKVHINSKLIDKVTRTQNMSLQYSLVQFFLGKIKSKSLINSMAREVKTISESPDLESEQDLSCQRSELQLQQSKRDPAQLIPNIGEADRILDDFPSRAPSPPLSWRQQEQDDILFFQE